MAQTIEPIRFTDNVLWLLDQRLLPAETSWLRCDAAAAVAQAIRDMVVRGAPAIGIAAAYGIALEARRAPLAPTAPVADWQAALGPALTQLAEARPTAVNLFWAIDRARAVIAAGGDIAAGLESLALSIHRDDIAANRRMGELGAALLGSDVVIYTHCNTGALATGGYGTALGVVRAAWTSGRLRHVYAGETRPWLQGARLTAWELLQEGIPFDLCVEGAAGSLFARGGIDWVIVGADRVAANGDVANKIGTYNLAVLARHHGAKFMAVMPTSTVDLSIATGADIPIEARDAAEVLGCGGRRVAPPGCPAINPAFDVTPAGLIDVIVTERGVIERPDSHKMAALLEQGPVS